MTDYLIGTGGWAYFKVEHFSSLKAYSQLFNFVEINNTFYEHPNLRRQLDRRYTVPKDFVFSVKCHRDLTHSVGLKPVNEAYCVFSQMINYCQVLGASFLVLETPASYELSSLAVREAREFFSSANFKGVRIVWEPRAPLTTEAENLMVDFNIVHSVDLSRETPKNTVDVVYSRLFGKGVKNLYQFSDVELEDIDNRISQTGGKIAALAYHGVRMYSDAARFLKFKKTGEFLPVTSFTGADSARAVLAEDAKFPSSKEELIENQGWKVIDMDNKRRIHLSELLLKLPERNYDNLGEVMHSLGVIFWR